MKMRYFARIGIQKDGAAAEELGIGGVISKIQEELDLGFYMFPEFVWDSACTGLDVTPYECEHKDKSYKVYTTKADSYLVKRKLFPVSDNSEVMTRIKGDLEKVFGEESGVVAASLWAQTTC